MESVKQIGKKLAAHEHIALIAAAVAWLIGFYFNAREYLPMLIHNTEVQFNSHPLFEPLFLNTWVAIAAYSAPILFGLALIFIPNLYAKLLCSVFLAMCTGTLCIHIESFNDATFVSSFWVALWMIWYCLAKITGSFEKTHAIFWAQTVVALIFLGGFIGKLTPEYHSGEVIYELFLRHESTQPISVLRFIFDEPALKTVSIFLTLGMIAAEGAVAMGIFLSNRAFTIITCCTILTIAFTTLISIFSVMGCILGLVIAAKILYNQVHPKLSPPEKATTPENTHGDSIIFFDGECGMCNTFVQKTLKADKDEHFKFAPLQGKLAAEKLPAELTKNLGTVVLIHQGHIFTHSAAVKIILDHTKQHRLLRLLLNVLATWVTDLGYRIVAKYRHKLYPHPDHCEILPETTLKDRFFE